MPKNYGGKSKMTGTSKKSKSPGSGAASPEVGAGTTYSYGKSGQKQRNSRPEPIVNK